MCGIVGALSFDAGAFRVTDRYLTPMRDTMIHRGPNGGANWIAPDGRIGLGHRRLSIIDLTTVANQPMSNEDGSLWVVFNGEIYNHAEIRQELVRLGGHRWKTDHSDTEVILHAFEEWGIEGLHKFRGMFAIGLWDARKKELWLIRDRIGIKPLYYSQHHGRLTFASEIKALLADPDQPRAVNEPALLHYLSFVTTPAPETMFAGIKKLPPGTWLKISADGRMIEHRYWDVWDHTQPLTDLREDELAERLLAELRTAVKLRKVSDVPVGVFLSGGIDSSTNAALFTEGDQQRVKTFTIGYRDEHVTFPNETEQARAMATLVGADHYEQLLTVDDLTAFLPQMVHLQDEPLGDPVCVPVYFVSKLARDQGVIVCQVGEGADELFCGYPTWKNRWRLARCNDWWGLPGLRTTLLSGLHVAGRGDGLVAEALRRAHRGQPMFWGTGDIFYDAEKTRLLSSRLRQQLRGRSSWDALQPIYQRYRDKAWEQSHLNWMTYCDLNLRLPEQLLMRIDKMSMGVSLEGRVPFLDHKVVELTMSMPSAIRFRDGNLKSILKKAVRGLIPEAVIDRKKQGFGVPVHDWVLGRLGPLMRKTVLDFVEQSDLLDRHAVTQVLDQQRGERTWYLMNLAMWWQQFIAQQPAIVERRAA